MGEPSFFEIGVPDGARAKAFYRQLFGWTLHPMGGDNAAIETPGVDGGLHDQDADRTIEVYFRSDDIDADAARVRACGGTADDPGPEVEGFGRFTRCTDDQGVRFGLHQPPS